jgi:hypothetical protein
VSFSSVSAGEYLSPDIPFKHSKVSAMRQKTILVYIDNGVDNTGNYGEYK